MKIIDANTGKIIRIGETFKNINGVMTLLEVEKGFPLGWFEAYAIFQVRQIFTPPPLINSIDPKRIEGYVTTQGDYLRPMGGGHYQSIPVEFTYVIAKPLPGWGPGHEFIRVPLQVRWTHPSFPFQHVAFIPS